MSRLRAVSKTATEEDGDIDLGCAEERPPLIPSGSYEVGYVRASESFWSFGHTRILLYFKILTVGEHHGKELYMACRISPRKGKKSLAASSKLVRACTVALGHSPTRTDRLNTVLFKRKAFLALVETVEVDPRKQPLPVEARYSVIRLLTERVAGA